MLPRIWISPPLAIGRLGNSDTPVDMQDLVGGAAFRQ